LGEPLRASRSRRAIRSISHFSPLGFRGWFRYYPSRIAPFGRVSAASLPLVSSMLVSSTCDLLIFLSYLIINNY
jgi:hypothetical protein